jgi:glyceraldehyde-3-phosphate dehydrogenase/erythrose-4-phosphate dehydrogenase
MEEHSVSKNVHVVGTGTIGEPLTGLLLTHREAFGIGEVSFHKRTPLMTDRSKVLNLVDKGARLVVDEDRAGAFRELGMEPSYETHEALGAASVVIDCTPIGNRMKEMLYSKYTDTVSGFIAQGSEFGFGRMYARGINDHALRPGQDQFIQVVSCNTHNLAVITDTVAGLEGGAENLASADFVCLRRANDISQDDSFMPAPTVGVHKDERFGTHHARDLWHLYQTLDIDLGAVFSSALKLPTQYMHTIHFRVDTRSPIDLDQVKERIRSNPRLATTYKQSSNSVFSFGRDHGHFGRILNQTVFCLPSFHLSQDRRTLTGFCFTPQDGNSLLSSVSATLWFLDADDYAERLQALQQFFFDEI